MPENMQKKTNYSIAKYYRVAEVAFSFVHGAEQEKSRQ